jgi:hypothetical protein
MSLKFLAVGQSVAGLCNDKSSYSLRKVSQLPTFESAPRFKHTERSMVQTDWLMNTPRPSAPAPMISEQAPVERQLPPLPPPPTLQAQRPKRGWFSVFRLPWFRTTKPRVDLVQSELTLEKVQPLRNDLVDSDLRLVLRRKNKTKAGEASAEQRGLEGSRVAAGWSELTAKLFELGQR